MKHFSLDHFRLILIFAGLTTLVVAGCVSFASQAASLEQTYDLPWWTIDGGGTTSVLGGSYSLCGTIGQPDAGSLTGGIYTLTGGFWDSIRQSGSIEPEKTIIYLPVIVRD